jgi:hypothetical protein
MRAQRGGTNHAGKEKIYMTALAQNTIGRWEINGYEMTSGLTIEVCIGNQWISGTIEWDGHRAEYVILLKGGGTLLITPSIKIRRLAS